MCGAVRVWERGSGGGFGERGWIGRWRLRREGGGTCRGSPLPARDSEAEVHDEVLQGITSVFLFLCEMRVFAQMGNRAAGVNGIKHLAGHFFFRNMGAGDTMDSVPSQRCYEMEQS